MPFARAADGSVTAYRTRGTGPPDLVCIADEPRTPGRESGYLSSASSRFNSASRCLALLLPLTKTPEDIMDFYWGALNADNRVALAVKRITSEGVGILIRNREGMG